VSRAAIAAVDAGACVARALPSIRSAIASARAWRLIAAGKAAGPMTRACLAGLPRAPLRAMAVAPAWVPGAPPGVEAFAGGHPTPNEGSLAAGRRALEFAAESGGDDVLVVLLSGGASALLEQPADGLTIEDLQAATAHLLRAGADITALNAVRKHLSLVKGGRLAAASAGQTIALAISDVVGDDLSVIASGPTVGDPTTYAEALGVLARFAAPGTLPDAVRRALEAGAGGARPETPKPGSEALSRASTLIVGSAADALEGARRDAQSRGYDVRVLAAPVVGEARTAAAAFAAALAAHAASAARPVCLLSCGETTVTVRGRGRGGRNQEFALALTRPLEALGSPAIVASVGTDGIDGPTDAAGALVDQTTAARAAAAGLAPPEAYLRDNDAYAFFGALGDLVVTGPTGTNVGDIQVTMLLPGGVT
jgi:hydroxypyruvate reductase